MAAQSVVEVDPGVFVYDFGQNFGGWTRLRARGPAGTRIVLRFAARADDQGRLDTINNMDVTQEDVYILQGGGDRNEIWEPSFGLHGFRYVDKYTAKVCRSEPPPLVNVAADGAPPHFALCHFATSLALEGVVISTLAGMPV